MCLRKRIEGGRAIFDVTIPKPLGITPKEFPNRPGVGIAGIKEGPPGVSVEYVSMLLERLLLADLVRTSQTHDECIRSSLFHRE